MLKNLLVHVPSEAVIRPVVDAAVSLAVARAAGTEQLLQGGVLRNLGPSGIKREHVEPVVNRGTSTRAQESGQGTVQLTGIDTEAQARQRPGKFGMIDGGLHCGPAAGLQQVYNAGRDAWRSCERLPTLAHSQALEARAHEGFRVAIGPTMPAPVPASRRAGGLPAAIAGTRHGGASRLLLPRDRR
jgi:hypothetical protein